MDRRSFVRGIASSAALAATPLLLPRSALAALPSGTLGSEELITAPGKRPLIKRSFRPPNYETPVGEFATLLTPSDRFFVRWHLASIPELDARDWRLTVSGDAAATPLELSLEDLRHGFERVEVVAVCQCAGNRRGLSDPHVAGVQWGYGAMGNARWGGVRLKDVLAKAGIAADTVEIAFDGADQGALDKTPDFIKSIPVWKAMDENTIIAFEMNGEPLPHLNGAPARIVVPGWAATYWMKKVVSIRALRKPLESFWMQKGYRIPKGKFPVVDRFATQENADTMPITDLVVNSLITSHTDAQRVRAGAPLTISGIAWDGGFGIRSVDLSVDGGRSWQAADIGNDAGRFSFRPWTFAFTPTPGAPVISARATNGVGATQVDKLIFNGGGYHNNVIQRIALQAE